ncbi:transporter substrate-binding domain-containing protein [Ruegeria sp. Ofav3-42]|uniref:transporter substrate-binding domain-containing protein n=1 Tax=Ruegeria sp. Ofav3-42 TaxID=2917759 RepID=UPI001EF40A8C|nr:transporter substrate-binding domain-containing protein [Ruegeria sp. Ofav3-42]MCG7521680.1 transporter substrate-binding domain-containing protein [Ruegeria sp. Ofav3-42]
MLRINVLNASVRHAVFVVAAGLGVLVSAVSAWAQSPELDLTDHELEWLAEHPTIRLGVDPGFPPWEYIDENGEYKGVMPDYVRVVGERLGITFEHVVEPKFKQLTERAKHKTLDLLPGLHITPEREEFLLFSDGYFSGFGDGIFTRVGYESIPDVDALSGKTVALVEGHNLAEKTMKANPQIIPAYFNDVAKALEAVAIGGADAAVVGIATAAHEIRRLKIVNLKVASSQIDKPSDWHMGVRNDWPIFVAILNKALDSITEKEHLVIRKKWVNLDQPPEQKAMLSLSDAEVAWLAENPVVHVAAHGQMAPIGFSDAEGQAQGVSIDILRWIEKALPVTFEISTYPTSTELLRQLEDGIADLVAALGRAPKQEGNASFTAPYMTLPVAIFAGPATPYVSDLQELSGKAVAVLTGDPVAAQISNEFPSIELVEFGNSAEAVRELSLGNVDAFVGDLLTTSYYLGEVGLTQIKVVGETPYSTRLAMATRPDQATLASIMQKAINAIPESDISAFRQRWIAFRYEQGFDYSLLWRVLVPLLVVTALIVYWNRRLSREVSRRVAAETNLQSKNTRLNEMNADLEAYAHTIAHGLKSPLAAASHFVEILKQYRSGNFDPEQDKLLAQTLETLRSSGETVDDLLLMSMVSTKDIDTEEIDTQSIVDRSLQVLEPMWEEAEAEISLPDTWPDAVGHAPWVEQIWLNYLSNAFKYAQRPAQVELGGEYLSPDVARYWVTSNGPTLTSDEISQLFVPFGRLNTDGVQGHGLGLVIVRRIAERLGGTAGAAGMKEGGNRFYFTLPATEQNRQSDDVAVTSPSESNL